MNARRARIEVLHGQRDLADRRGRTDVGVVPERDDQRTVGAAGEERPLRGAGEALLAELMEQRERVEGGLGDTPRSEQPEASVERRLHHTLLLEDVGEGPVGHVLDESVALADRLREPGTHAACAVAGPPTRNRGSTALSARAVWS